MKIVTIGKRMISLEQIAYIEPFDATSNPEFKSDKAYKGRVVLLVNRVVDFKIEIFEPSENFKPSKPSNPANLTGRVSNGAMTKDRNRANY